MKRKALLFLFIPVFLLSSSVAEETEVPQAYTSRTKVASGYFATVSSLCLFDDFNDPDAVTRYEETWDEVKSLLEEIEQTVSVEIPTSDIARFNALPSGGSVSIQPLTASLLRLAREMYERTSGYYDPTVYPLVDLWGFSPRFTYSSEAVQPYDRERENGTLPAPDSAYIEGFLQLVGMEGVELGGSEEEGYVLTKKTPSVEIGGVTYSAKLDLGGIAKGYAVDLVRDLLLEKGYEYGYFSCGTSSIYVLKSASASAKKANDPHFQLNIRSPRETPEGTGDYARLTVMNSSLSSSGDYGHSYELNGQRYCHIIHPFTGYPMNVSDAEPQQGVCTVTLMSESAAEDDALTTALCLMGLDAALEYLNEAAQDIVLVYYRSDSDRYEVVTNLPEERITLLDAAYVLCSERDETGRVRYTGELLRP